MSRGASSSPRLSLAARSSSSSGHGASGLTWSIVTGETPPQSSMPASSSAREVAGQVRRRLHRDLRRQDQPRGRDRPQQLLERRLGRVGHPRAGLRAEVLDDHLLHVRPGRRDRAQRVEPLLARLADADQDPGRERHARLAREPQRLEPRRGQLVGRAEVRAAARRQPLRRSSRASAPSTPRPAAAARSRPRVSTPGLRCGSSDVSSSTARAASARYSTRRRAAERRQLVARRAVAQLRLVAEREQRLAAAGPLARPRDLEHLVDRHVRRGLLHRRHAALDRGGVPRRSGRRCDSAP